MKNLYIKYKGLTPKEIMTKRLKKEEYEVCEFYTCAMKMNATSYKENNALRIRNFCQIKVQGYN